MFLGTPDHPTHIREREREREEGDDGRPAAGHDGAGVRPSHGRRSSGKQEEGRRSERRGVGAVVLDWRRRRWR